MLYKLRPWYVISEYTASFKYTPTLKSAAGARLVGPNSEENENNEEMRTKLDTVC